MFDGWIRCAAFPGPLSPSDIKNGRINSADVINRYRRRIWTEDTSWMAQANDIFNRLEITRDFEDYGIFSSFIQ
jgi:hypothetical protein